MIVDAMIGIGAAFTIAAVLFFHQALLRWRPWRAVATVGLAVAVLVATPGVASAEYWGGYVWQGNPSCGYIQRTLDNSGHPYMAMTGYVPWVVNGSLCASWSNYQPPQTITDEQNLYAWINNQVIVCNYGPPVVNNSWAQSVSTGYSWSSKPCNSGNWGAIWYYQNAGLWFRDQNNNFRSGSTNSNWVDIS